MNYIEQHENTTVADIMFIKRWYDIAAKCWTAKKNQTTANKYFEKTCIKLKCTVVICKYCIYLYLNCNITGYNVIHCSIIYLKYHVSRYFTWHIINFLFTQNFPISRMHPAHICLLYTSRCV